MSRSWPIRAVSAAVLAVALCAPRTSAAQDARALANEALRAGNALRDAGRCGEALARFEQARRLFPDAARKIGVNVAGALECMGRYREAAEHLARFLERPDADADAAALDALRRRARALELRLARLTVRCPAAGATVALDGTELGRAPLERMVRVDPGRHRLVARHPRRATLLAEVTLARGESRLVLLDWPAAPPPRQPPRARRPFYTRWWFWTAVGATLVVGASAALVASQTGGSQRLPGGELGQVVLKP